MINKRFRYFVLLFFIVSGVFLSINYTWAITQTNINNINDAYIGLGSWANMVWISPDVQVPSGFTVGTGNILQTNDIGLAQRKFPGFTPERIATGMYVITIPDGITMTDGKFVTAPGYSFGASDGILIKDSAQIQVSANEPTRDTAQLPDDNKPKATAQAAAVPAVITTTLNVPLGNISEFTVGGNILGLYLQYWYGFLIGTIGILATVMIMWGGFQYLTSAGDKGKAGDGQKIITSAVTGIVIAFGVYTILYLINPNLLTINIPSIGSITTTAFNLPSLSGSHGTPTEGYGPTVPTSPSAVCSNMNAPAIDFDALKNQNEAAALTGASPINCSEPNSSKLIMKQYDSYFDQYGTNANLLRAIALAESNGDTNAGSQAGACGLMQIITSTATALNNGKEVTCEQLKSDPELSIMLANKYLTSAQKNYSGSDLIAGYNGGYGTNRGNALSSSINCGDGIKAYECCTNPGKLVETQNYVPRVNRFLYCYNNQ